MIWLMDYAKFWKDKNNTFCDSIKTNSTFLANVNRDSFAPLDHPLMKFLALTKEITESCPDQCQCNIARTTIESKNKLHQVHFLLRLFRLYNFAFWSEKIPPILKLLKCPFSLAEK